MTDRHNVDPAWLRGMTMRRVSRRDLLKAGGVGVSALSLGGILAACGGSGGTGTGGDSAAIDWSAKPSGTLEFANWPLYMDGR